MRRKASKVPTMAISLLHPFYSYYTNKHMTKNLQRELKYLHKSKSAFGINVLSSTNVS